MIYLALDTATPACSVALWHHGERQQKMTLEARQHTQVLLPMVEALLREHHVQKQEVKGVICSIGPGAFTGLRVGAAVAMGLAMAWQCPLAPLSSLALLASTARRKTGWRRVAAVLDARMDELYCGVFDDLKALQPEQLSRPEALALHDWNVDGVAGLGLSALNFAPQCELYPEAMDAFDFLDVLNWQPPESALQLQYLRQEVVQA